MATDEKTISGVQELIDRLRDDGIASGKKQADQILENAQAKVRTMVSQAGAEVKTMRARAEAEVAAEKKAFEEALRLAARDTELKLENELRAVFAAHVRHLVALELQDSDFLRQLILQIAGIATRDIPSGQKLDIKIADHLFKSDEKSTELTDAGQKQLHNFILGVSREMLRAGVELHPAGNDNHGIKVSLVGEELEIDLSEKALMELLLQQLAPKFRSVMQGSE